MLCIGTEKKCQDTASILVQEVVRHIKAFHFILLDKLGYKCQFRAVPGTQDCQ